MKTRYLRRYPQPVRELASSWSYGPERSLPSSFPPSRACRADSRECSNFVSFRLNDSTTWWNDLERGWSRLSSVRARKRWSRPRRTKWSISRWTWMNKMRKRRCLNRRLWKKRQGRLFKWRLWINDDFKNKRLWMNDDSEWTTTLNERRLWMNDDSESGNDSQSTGDSQSTDDSESTT